MEKSTQNEEYLDSDKLLSEEKAPSYLQLVALFGGIFIVSGVPFFLSFPSGAAMSSLSAGLSLALERFGWVVFATGILMAVVTKTNHKAIILPIGFIAMMLLGQLIEIAAIYGVTNPLRICVLGAVLLLAVAACWVRDKQVYVSLTAVGVLGYYVGGAIMRIGGESTAPLYHVVGSMMVITLVLSLAISVAIAVKGQLQDWMGE